MSRNGIIRICIKGREDLNEQWNRPFVRDEGQVYLILLENCPSLSL